MAKILFSAFDAGGGNAIFPVIKNIFPERKYEVFCIIGGPSKEIFLREDIKFIDADLLTRKDLRNLVKDFHPDFFISGTSMGHRFDRDILPVARELGAKSIYIIDYWAHYWERFSGFKKDLAYLPDLICVMDSGTKEEMAAEGFDPKKIAVTGNPYFDYFQKNIRSGKEDRKTVLFMSQPISDRRDEFGYDEFGVLDDLLGALGDLREDFRVVIRQHPKEAVGKFDKYIGKNVSIDSGSPVEEIISGAGLIVGMNSMVLFQAAIAGKKVISYQPGLKTKDFLISNMLGLSRLAVKKSDLEKLLKEYFSGKFPEPGKASGNAIVPNAAENIIKLIDQYEKR